MRSHVIIPTARVRATRPVRLELPSHQAIASHDTTGKDTLTLYALDIDGCSEVKLRNVGLPLRRLAEDLWLKFPAYRTDS